MKGTDAGALEVFTQVLDSWFVADRGIGLRSTGGWVGWIFSALAVHLEELLGLGVVALKIFIRYRPGGRGAPMVTQLAEIFQAKAKQGGAIELRIPADVVVGVRVERLAVLVAP